MHDDASRRAPEAFAPLHPAARAGVDSLAARTPDHALLRAIRQAGDRALTLAAARGDIDPADSYRGLLDALDALHPYRDACDPAALATSFRAICRVRLGADGVVRATWRATDSTPHVRARRWTLPLSDARVRLVLAAQHDDADSDVDGRPRSLSETTWRRVLDCALVTLEIHARAAAEAARGHEVAA